MKTIILSNHDENKEDEKNEDNVYCYFKTVLTKVTYAMNWIVSIWRFQQSELVNHDTKHFLYQDFLVIEGASNRIRLYWMRLSFVTILMHKVIGYSISREYKNTICNIIHYCYSKNYTLVVMHHVPINTYWSNQHQSWHHILSLYEGSTGTLLNSLHKNIYTFSCWWMDIKCQLLVILWRVHLQKYCSDQLQTWHRILSLYTLQITLASGTFL